MTRFIVFAEAGSLSGPFVFGLVSAAGPDAAREKAVARLQSGQWALGADDYEALAGGDGEVAVGVAEVIEMVSVPPEKLVRGEGA